VQRVCYLGTIPVPSTGNDDWVGPGVAVRVDETTDIPAGVTLLFGETLPAGQAARLDTHREPGRETRAPGPPYEALLVGPNCARAELSTEVVDTPFTVIARAAATGFQPEPRFLFTINGNPLGAGAGPGQTPSPNTRPATVRADVALPTGYDESTFQAVDINLSWAQVGNELTFTVPGGDGRYQLRIGVTVAPSGAGVPVTAQAEAVVDVTTREIRLTEESRKASNQCKKSLDRKVRVEPVGPEDPLGPIEFPRDWSVLSPDELVDAVTRLHVLEGFQPRVAHAVAVEAARQLGVHPNTVTKALRVIDL
jgi:hypothetical protein